MIRKIKLYICNNLVKLFIKLNKIAQLKIYNGYRIKYNIDNTVKFNGPGIKLYGEGVIEIVEKSYIGEYSFLQSDHGCSIIIGSNCAISHNVKVYTNSYLANQDFNDETRKTYWANVCIGNWVWIGVNVLINLGIKIGNNCVIAANSVVTKDIPANSIYGGVPAKLLKNKFD